MQQPGLHSNTIQQQAFLSSHPQVNIAELPQSMMINPTVSSTPISASTKRGRNDTSGVSESNTQVRPQYQQITRIVNSNNTQIKRLRGMNQPIFQPTDNIQQPTIAACRFATTRFPFSPFS
ncbi:unnamed protein product, partial [Rotaria sp. Silwood2]